MSSKDYLQGMPTEIVSQFDSQIVENIPSNRTVQQTVASLHVYANGSTGSDSNDGLTALTPKKTLTAAIALIPFSIAHNTCIHVEGTFEFANEPSSIATIARMTTAAVTLLIDGGTNTTVVSGPFTATGSGVGSLTVTGAGWVVDSHAGYWVEPVVNGVPVIEKRRLITANTADTITVVREWAVDPGLVTFQIVRPSTVFTKDSGNGSLTLQNYGFGGIRVQNIYVPAKSFRFVVQNSVNIYFTHVVSDSTYVNPWTVFNGSAWAFGYRLNPSTWTYESSNAYSFAGIGWRSPSFGNYIQVQTGIFNLSGCYVGCVTVTGTAYSLLSMSGGTRIWMLTIGGVVQPTSPIVANSAGYARTKIGKGDVGLLAFNSQFKVGSGVEITDNAIDGIRINSSNMILDGDVKGASNGQYGVKATMHSSVATLAGTPPTITGGTANFIIWTGGGSQNKSWADLETAGVILSDDQMTMFNKGY